MPRDTAEVILKGEIHTSESDLDEERELIIEGIDALVIEGEREDAEYGILRSWYSTAMSIVGLVFFDILYTDHRILTDLADAQDADVVSTRESDAELLENAHPAVEVVAALLFYGIFVFSIFWGLITGNTTYGAAYLLASAIFPLYLLRSYEMNQGDDESNRDQIITDRIVEAASDSGRVVAVVGSGHVKAIEERLPEFLDVEVRPPVYGRLSIQHAKEVFIPAFTAYSVLFVGYIILLEVFRTVIAIVL